MKKKMKIICFILILLILVAIWIGVVIYRYNLLKSLRDSLLQFKACENYSIEDWFYYKDGIMKQNIPILTYFDVAWSDGKMFYYINNKDKKAVKQLPENCSECRPIIYEEIELQNLSNSELLKMALDLFSINISKSEFVGENSSLSGIIVLKINKEKIIYFSLDTKLPIFFKEADYYFEYPIFVNINSVTDEDVEIDIENYKIYNEMSEYFLE